jgi:hypothetical protein
MPVNGATRPLPNILAHGGETMRLLIAGSALAAALAAMTATAQAQQGNQVNNAARVGQHAGAANARGTSEPNVKANDKAYDAALKNLPDRQYDPWRGVR